MNLKLLVILFFVVSTLGVGGFLLLDNNASNEKPIEIQADNTTPSPSPAENDNEPRITLTEKGFEPIELTVSAGEKVIWINNSGRSATVDSNPHPIHTSYPEMNLGSFDTETTLEFVFRQSGTYNFHNHFNPSQSGTITVK